MEFRLSVSFATCEAAFTEENAVVHLQSQFAYSVVEILQMADTMYEQLASISATNSPLTSIDLAPFPRAQHHQVALSAHLGGSPCLSVSLEFRPFGLDRRLSRRRGPHRLHDLLSRVPTRRLGCRQGVPLWPHRREGG